MMVKNKLQSQVLDFSQIAVRLADNGSNSRVENMLFENLIRNVVTIGGLLNVAFYGLSQGDIVRRLDMAMDEIGKSSYIVQLLLSESAVNISMTQDFFIKKNELMGSIVCLINDMAEQEVD